MLITSLPADVYIIWCLTFTFLLNKITIASQTA